jgi:chloramphenicol 3-O phosphotransferase
MRFPEVQKLRLSGTGPPSRATTPIDYSRHSKIVMIEPSPPPGRIIFLTGPSSSGKTTLAAGIQKAMPKPFLHFSSDHFTQTLDPRRTTDGPFAYWSSVRPRFFKGLHRSIAAFASAGNDLIVDHLIEFSAWRDELRELLSGLDVFLVGVHCSIEELERRGREGEIAALVKRASTLRPTRFTTLVRTILRSIPAVEPPSL